MSFKKRDRSKDRSNWFVCVSQDPEQIEHLKESCQVFKRWFYIEHDPDNDDGVHHIHVMVKYSGSALIKTVANTLGIPENFVQFADNYRSYAKYMIHQGYDEKIQYKVDDVKTNVPGFYKSLLVDISDTDISSLFSDLHNLQFGTITLDDFINLHFVELQGMPFYQKVKIFELLDKLAVRTT